MTLLENIQWGTSPTITGSISYEKQRSGADMQYRVQIIIDAVTGVRYFGYPIYAQVSLDNLQKDSATIKNASPSQWTTAYTYTTPWMTAAGKTSGTTVLKVRIYSGMGTTRDISYSYDLPTDPAASLVAVQNGTMGQNVTITITRYNQSFTHTLKYSFGALSGTITTGLQANTYTWQIPLNFANQVTNATSGTGTITLTTYNGSAVMGSTTATFTATVPASVVPTISSVSISEAVSGIAEQFSGYVQSKSKLNINTSSAGAYNSTIRTIDVTFEGTKYIGSAITTNAIIGSGTIIVSIIVTDSRGRTASTTRNVNVIAYVRPTISGFQAYRANANGTANDDGAYLGFSLNYAISPANNRNTKVINVQYKKADETTWHTAKQYTSYSEDVTDVSSAAVLDVDYSYNIRVTATDYFETVTRNLGEDIATSGDVFDIYATGKGFAFGKAAEGEYFEISDEWPVIINNYAALTWTTPEIYSARCTVTSGGYAKLGKKVEVNIVITIVISSATSSWLTYLYNLPAPVNGYAALSISRLDEDASAGVYSAFIYKSGNIGYLGIHPHEISVPTPDNGKFVITGSYWAE